ncbi:MAG: IS3 family transposase, partial [Bacilli bacterium]|nr:IS3 family transposase [Bacilli bacterium]
KRFSLVKQEDKYETISELHKNNGFTIEFLCETLEIARSSYYKWLNRQIPNKEKQDNELAAIIIEFNEAFEGILGYRRMTDYINYFNNANYSEKYIHRLMKVMRVHARIRRKKSNYVKVKPEQVGENILARNFTAEHPNQKWCTDVTEFKVPGQKQKLYLSAIIDLFDRSIVSYVFSNSNNNKLVFDTFDKALEANPGAKPIFHSDRGFQYTSKQFKFKLDEAGMIQSMSRVGKCIDNGPMEGFWGTLKSESFYGLKFSDEQALRNKIEEYIFFYNNYRLQKNLKGMTPNEVRYHANCNFIYF